MASPIKRKTFVCEQCGAPLVRLPGEDGCLNCLLSTGIEGEVDPAARLPNEPVRSRYQHYEILIRPDGTLWELGRGAMGVTYKARDINLETLVALKIINARFSARPEARRRFLREAQAAARLRHPNVATVFHLGAVNHCSTPDEEEKSDCFYVMEFVDGESLEARLGRAGPLNPLLALDMALQVARALAAAEKQGLVHRDLKPSNIMLVAEEEISFTRRATNTGPWAKVIDFGLAKVVDNETESSGGRPILGTPAFSSPEQREGRAVDIRSDIYSLGATLWYALTGKPIGRSTADMPFAVGRLATRDVPAPLIALLQSMLAPQPNDRPRSAFELTEALEDCRKALTEAADFARRRACRWVVGAGLGLAAALVALVVYISPPASSVERKSIAVLPFRNLGHNPDDAFFAEGVEDDILSRLIKVHDLKVISRLGTARYGGEAPRDLRAIGHELGVRHLLEGSLRRSGDRVLLHVSLVDAEDGHEVWSEGYDRTLTDAINLQGELASKIANALDATLSPQERGDVLASSTRNPDAYVLYLRGRQLAGSPTFRIADHEAAQVLYTQAVTIDPGFALAHAQLASTLSLLHRFRGPSDGLRAVANAEARKALELEPKLGEAHLAKALCFYRIERDYDRAMPELEIAQRLLPNDTEAESVIAYIHRRRGDWRTARAGLEHALSRDPHNRIFEEELHATACLLRDWPAAAERAAQAVKLAPEIGPLKAERALVDVWRSGDLVPLQRFFAAVPGYGDSEGNLAWQRWDAAMIGRKFQEAEAALGHFPFETLPSVLGAPIPKSYLVGCISLA
ncbi:MAG TPA: protein kinase, partial [Chthoniobacterales bacterium]|nr:protein kinase [Chthoniobacterales bacterium]